MKVVRFSQRVGGCVAWWLFLMMVMNKCKFGGRSDEGNSGETVQMELGLCGGL